MKDLSNATEAQTWAEMNFKSVQLLDSRRTTRLVEIARGLAEGKGPGLARLGNSWYTTKAIYHLLKQETHDSRKSFNLNTENSLAKRLSFGKEMFYCLKIRPNLIGTHSKRSMD